MYLQKTFTDQYGHTSDFFEVELENLQSNGHVEANVLLKAYTSQEAKDAGKTIVDCFRGVLNGGRFSCTDEDITIATGASLGEKTKRAFLEKAMASILDEEGNETNLFTGNVGEMAFQDAVILT